jgi:hypothetical protein
MVKFPFEFIILKIFIAETVPIVAETSWETKFRENIAHFRIIFAFCENGKTRFRFNPIHTCIEQ